MTGRARNTARASDPPWSGAENEWALLVARGEPRRSDEQMTDVLIDQTRRYLAGFTDVTDVDAEQLARLVASDHVGVGVKVVSISRAHLLKYVGVLRGRAKE